MEGGGDEGGITAKRKMKKKGKTLQGVHGGWERKKGKGEENEGRGESGKKIRNNLGKGLAKDGI